MNQVRRDVVQGFKDEPPFVQARMRNLESGPANHSPIIEEQIQVQSSGSISPVPSAAQSLFDPAERSQSFRRRKESSGLHGQVQKIAGSFHFDRFCLIDSGPSLNLETLLFQQLKTAPDIIRAPAQVTADADVDSRHG